MNRRYFSGPLAAALVLAACSDNAAPVNPVQSITKVASTDNQQAPAGTIVPTSPRVTLVRADGQKAEGAVVVFTVASGGGSVTGGTVQADILGVARVGAWTLGPSEGPNTLTATTSNGLSVTFTAVGVPGPAVAISAVNGDEQTATVGTEVPVRPEVQAVDQFGNGVDGVEVTWRVVKGGGTVIGQSNVFTENGGFAMVGGWELGPTAGENLLEAEVQGFQPVQFRATGTP